MRKRPLALGQQRVGEVVEGPPTVFAPVAFDPWPVMIGPPGTDMVAVTPGALERAILPPEHMDIGVTGVGIEELVERGEYRHS